MSAGPVKPLTAEQVDWFARAFSALVNNVEQAVLGKRHVVRLALACLISQGHLLIEDVPGTGKTLLAKAIASSVQGTHSRIRFTSDLLPSDVVGLTFHDQRAGQFIFQAGPIFASIVLAEEINQAAPKTLSALCEVMDEGLVTVDGLAHPIGRPFMVIATQNPAEQGSARPLPDAQLDRFLMATSLGYPDHAATVALMASAATSDRSAIVQNVITSSAITQMSSLADHVHVDPAILGYIADLAEESRSLRDVRLGLSVRGCLAYVRAARTWRSPMAKVTSCPVTLRSLRYLSCRTGSSSLPSRSHPA